LCESIIQITLQQLKEINSSSMNLIETVGDLNYFLCGTIFKHLTMVHELIKVVEVSGALVLITEMGEQLDITLRSKDPLFFKDVLLQVHPEELVVDTEPVEKLGNLHIGSLFFEGDHVLAQVPQELLECRLL
jgi:hypothetical protein